MTCEDLCYPITNDLIVDLVDESNQEEADTILFLHANHSAQLLLCEGYRCIFQMILE